MELLVRDTNIAIAQVTQMAADNGGYIISSQTWDSDGYKHATLRLGVPSSAFEQSLNFLRTLAVQVLKEATSGQDVTADYTDLQTRLTNLEATAARVREFLVDAKTVEESLRINQQLSELEGQIAQVQRLKKDYDAAIASYQKVIEGDPNNDRAKIEIGMTYLEKGDFAAAETALLQVATSTSASREVFYNLGEVKFAKAETDEAVKYYQRAVDMDSTWGKPLFKIGLAKLQKADMAGAIETMQKVIAVDPNSAEAAQAKSLIEQLKKG